MFTRKTEAAQHYAAARAEATDAVAAPVASYPLSSYQLVDEAPATQRQATGFQAPTAQYDSQESIIGPDLRITGNVISRGRVRLDGTIEGDMRCTSLVVSETGAITGGIIAGEVAVYGRVAGTIKGKRVALFATAHVEGDITHQGIGVEMGTHYDGRLRWSATPLDDLDTVSTEGLELPRR